MTENVETSKPINTSNALAMLLSLVIPGLGQLIQGRVKKGIGLIIAAVISLILMLVLIGFLLYFVVWVYAMFDAITYRGVN